MVFDIVTLRENLKTIKPGEFVMKQSPNVGIIRNRKCQELDFEIMDTVMTCVCG